MILIDERDGSKELLAMPSLAGHCAETRLDFPVGDNGKEVACGDAMLTGHGPEGSNLKVGIELKQVSDLLTSISTGRLGGTQIPRMLKAFDVVLILSYGVYRRGPSNFLQVQRWRNGKKSWNNYRVGSRPVPYSYLEGFLMTAQIKGAIDHGKPVIHKHVFNLEEAAAWLIVLNHWLFKPWDRHRGLAVFDRSREISAPPNVDPVEFQIAKTAASLPGIDWVRGWSAAAYFDSVFEMVNADTREWQKIKGIGPVLSKEAVRAIRSKKG